MDTTVLFWFLCLGTMYIIIPAWAMWGMLTLSEHLHKCLFGGIQLMVFAFTLLYFIGLSHSPMYAFLMIVLQAITLFVVYRLWKKKKEKKDWERHIDRDI